VDRLIDVLLRTWDLGFTAFGGPPVHFRILHRRFVEQVEVGQGNEQEGEKWVDEQTVSFRHQGCFHLRFLCHIRLKRIHI
jgi:chromate transport protein ChrA